MRKILRSFLVIMFTAFIPISVNGQTQKIANGTVKTQGNISLRGKVVDINGEAIPGVIITVKEYERGGITAADGSFSMQVPNNRSVTLVFSFVGMKSVTRVIDGNKLQETIHVTMEEDSQNLGEVIVTGVFQKSRESYTGAVSTVTNEQLQMFKGQNLLQTLKSIDASLNFAVNNIAGSNPNNLPQINIRGNSSLPMSVEEYNQDASNQVNAPLVILDGFEISLEKLMDYNDDEIESINILKDAAATAIYGSRGSNGVIVVITKQPEPGKLKLNAQIGIDIEAPDLSSYHLLNASQKLELEHSLGLYDYDHPESELDYNKVYNDRLLKVLSGVDTDWLKKPVRTGIGTHYNLRLEGGHEDFRWSATANYKDVEGAMKNSSRRTFNGGIILMYSVKNLLFKNYTSYGVTRAVESNYGSYSNFVSMQPYNSPYDENGELVEYFEGFYGGDGTAGYSKVQNPLYDASLNTFDKSGYEELTNNFSIEWNILEGLTLRGALGISVQNNHSDYFLPAEHSYFTTGSNEDTYNTEEGFFRKGLYRYGVGKNYDYSGNLTLSYSKVFNDKHQIYIGLDYSMAESESSSYEFELEGFSNEDMNFLGNARQYNQDVPPTGSMVKTRRLGLTGNANYTYDSRYYVDISYRVDGSSTFGSNKKYAPFYSTGIGWNLHNEKFLKGNKYIYSLRLKASYGQTGSQQGSTSGANTIYEYALDNRYVNWTGAVVTELGNPWLTWQTTDEFNIGTEFGLFDGRLKGEFNYYMKKTSNLLSATQLPLSVGFTSYMNNVGEVKNNGWEASLSGYIVRDYKKKINWMLSGQLVYNKNKISKLSEAIKAQNEAMLLNEDYDVANLFYEGRPQNAIYAVRSLGVDPSTGEETYLDKDGNITDTWKAGDKVYLGSKDPLYRGILSSMFVWNKFTFNISFNYYWGGKVYNQTLLDKVEVTRDKLKTTNVDSRVYSDRWMKPGDETFFKGFSDTATRATSRFVMDDNVLNLQSISFQYRWDTDWVKEHLKASSIIFAVNMSDIYYWGSVKMERGTSYPYARNIQGCLKLLF